MIGDPDQDLRRLVGMDGSPVTCIVGEQVFVMAPLTPSDYITCSEWRAQQRLALIFSTLPSNPLQDVTALKAEACAKLLTPPSTPLELLSDIECVCRLAEISLQRGGQFKGNWEGFKRGLSQTSYRDLERAVFKISGFLPPEDNGRAAVAENPT